MDIGFFQRIDERKVRIVASSKMVRGMQNANGLGAFSGPGQKFCNWETEMPSLTERVLSPIRYISESSFSESDGNRPAARKLAFTKRKRARGTAATPDVTVFCAVWHRQKNKIDFLRSHFQCLLGQSENVEIVYIFDGGDTPPEWLDATSYAFEVPLTIYEAWAAAVHLCETKYVMNLNLDDRLAVNAVETLHKHIVLSDAALVGGEWEILFSDEHLTSSFEVVGLSETHFDGAWPPKLNPVLRQRLGSGTGERGTFGPSTLWNLEMLGKWYPTNFDNGEKIYSIGDSLFWQLLMGKSFRLERLPLIIGRYLSDPKSQAEFRAPNEMGKLEYTGLSFPLKHSFCDRI